MELFTHRANFGHQRAFNIHVHVFQGDRPFERAAGNIGFLQDYCAQLAEAGVRVSLFIDADEKQLEAAMEIAAPVVIAFNTDSSVLSLSITTCKVFIVEPSLSAINWLFLKVLTHAFTTTS